MRLEGAHTGRARGRARQAACSPPHVGDGGAPHLLQPLAPRRQLRRRCRRGVAAEHSLRVDQLQRAAELVDLARAEGGPAQRRWREAVHEPARRGLSTCSSRILP